MSHSLPNPGLDKKEKQRKPYITEVRCICLWVERKPRPALLVERTNRNCNTPSLLQPSAFYPLPTMGLELILPSLQNQQELEQIETMFTSS